MRRMMVMRGAWSRGFADLGPGRKDYSDPCFERKGYVHEGFFGTAVKEKTGMGDRRAVHGSDFVSYSWGTDSRQRVLERERLKFEGFKVRDKSMLLENRTAVSSQNEEETADEEELIPSELDYPYTGGRLDEISSRMKAESPHRKKRLSYSQWKKNRLDASASKKR